MKIQVSKVLAGHGRHGEVWPSNEWWLHVDGELVLDVNDEWGLWLVLKTRELRRWLKERL